MTIYKIQGGTIKLEVNITSSFKDIFGDSQAYTVLSRAKQLDQLYLPNIYEDEIYTTRKPLVGLKELEERAINNNYIRIRDDQVNIIILNVQNLTHHIEDIKQHYILLLKKFFWAKNHQKRDFGPKMLKKGQVKKIFVDFFVGIDSDCFNTYFKRTIFIPKYCFIVLFKTQQKI